MNIIGAITNTVSITLFNRGLAGKIFEDVKKNGAKVVMKNNSAECVLMSPEEYLELMDRVNDANLLTLANSRVSQSDLDRAIPAEKLYSELGISAEDLADCDSAEIE